MSGKMRAGNLNGPRKIVPLNPDVATRTNGLLLPKATLISSSKRHSTNNLDYYHAVIFYDRFGLMDPGPLLQDSSKGGTEETPTSRKAEPEVDAAVQAVSILVNERLSLQASATHVQPSILALESLQDCINELQSRIMAKIVELKRFKNQNEVLLHTLPPEIFLEILSASIDWPNWNVERNHILAQVCK
ncbi:hypothetical protein M407DRAFT_33502, partial [Tulasnella calospora MUT 4182]